MEEQAMNYPEWVKGLGRVYREQGSSVFVEVPLAGFEDAMKRIKGHGIDTVNAISGHDSGKEIEVMYHFIRHGVVLTVKTTTGRKDSAVPSIVRLFPSAMLFEQENHEMLGLRFTGNPKMKPVLLSKDSPRTPLRKKEGGRK
jgi:NADH:ubiquinone oxidoreductase subunit C